MINQFKEDFHSMLRKSIGYLPWAKERTWKFYELIHGIHHCRGHIEEHYRQFVRKVTEEVVCESEVLDLFFKALMRAEIRYISRFIPQRSHEERLTGHLISEFGAAIELVRPNFNEKPHYISFPFKCTKAPIVIRYCATK